MNKFTKRLISSLQQKCTLSMAITRSWLAALLCSLVAEAAEV